MHRKEPWVLSTTIGGAKLPKRVILMQKNADGSVSMEPPIADFGIETEEAVENALRVAACVNACVGIPTHELLAAGLDGVKLAAVKDPDYNTSLRG